MPVYVYRCVECDKDTEVVQSIKEDAIQKCPDCGSDWFRVVQAVGFKLEGSGFHKNDYGAYGRNAPTYKDYVK